MDRIISKIKQEELAKTSKAMAVIGVSSIAESANMSLMTKNLTPAMKTATRTSTTSPFRTEIDSSCVSTPTDRYKVGTSITEVHNYTVLLLLFERHHEAAPGGACFRQLYIV